MRQNQIAIVLSGEEGSEYFYKMLPNGGKAFHESFGRFAVYLFDGLQLS